VRVPPPASEGAIPPAGAHGGDVAAVAAALGCEPTEILDLSASFNPDAPDLTGLAKSQLDSLERYPDATAATEAMAVALGTTPDSVLLTNGGAEAIALVAGDLGRAAVARPAEFSLYARHLGEVVDPADDPDAPRIRSNPNNPTGRLAAVGDTAAVWDEAFYPLATGDWTRGDPGAIVVGSLTKVFACPGLRVGYVLAPDATSASKIAARRPVWSLNALACSVVPDLLEHADLPGWVAALRTARDALAALLCRHELALEPSDANFVLVRNAAGLRDHLARRAVLVRDTSSFGIVDGVRIAVPDASNLQRLADAMEGFR
jgi:histidinol-phosphate/aromatic aminotransferase/cobyric acid decarboxylase-like protein